MKWSLIKLVAALGLMLIQTSAYAGAGNLFNVSSSGRPMSLNFTLCLDARGPLSCQTYTASALTLSITTTINHSYQAAGIKINTPGYKATGCTPIANGYCLFAVSKTTPATIIVESTSIKSPRFAYASSWDGDMLTLCSVASNGTFSNCNPIPAPNSLGVNQLSSAPGGIAVNPDGTFAYVADYYNGIFVCNINSTTATLSNCTATGSGFGSPEAISLNPAGTIAYIGDYSGGTAVIKCNVSATTGLLSGCGPTTYNTFSYPTNVVYNLAGTMAYVGNYDISQVYLCDVNHANGDLSDCVTTPTPPPSTLTYATGVALNSSGTILYVVSNDQNHVLKCPVNSDGTLAACTTTGTAAAGTGWPGFTSPFGITLNAAGTLAYIPNYDSDDEVTMCTVDSSSGELTNCAYIGSNFHEPLAVALLY